MSGGNLRSCVKQAMTSKPNSVIKKVQHYTDAANLKPLLFLLPQFIDLFSFYIQTQRQRRLMSIPTQISGFNVLPVLYKSSSSAASSSKSTSKSSSTTTHYLYVRAHASSSTNKTQLPEGRTLFLVNLPPDATERELVLFFKNSGTVEKVIFDFEVQEITTAGDDTDSEDDDDDGDVDMDGADQNQGQQKRGKKEKKAAAPTVTPLPSTPLRKLRKTGSSAYVIFLDASSLQKTLSQSSSSSKPRPWPTSEEPTGLTHYLSLYTSLRPPLSAVQEYADSSMALFEYTQAKNRLKKGKYNKGEAIVDEDGFTLVTRGGAYGKTLGGGVAVASKNFQRSGGKSNGKGAGSGRIRKKKERGEDGKDGFYAFQRAEKQRSGIFLHFICYPVYCAHFSFLFLGLLELKRKWEEDKAKVEKLKASRRFKPY